MHRKVTLATAATLLVLAGCGDDSSTIEAPGAELEVTRPAAGDTDNAQAQLEALPEGQRNGVFIRAIRDTQGNCQHVERSERAGAYEGNPVWRAHCQGDQTYSIVVTESGVAQVLNEAEVALVTDQSADDPARNVQ